MTPKGTAFSNSGAVPTFLRGERMSRNTVEEIVQFSRLSLIDDIQTFEVDDAVLVADSLIDSICPLDPDDERSVRFEPLRKIAHKHLATSHLFSILSSNAPVTMPSKVILTTINVSIGTDFPTPTDYASSFARIAESHFELGMKYLKFCQPITSCIG